MQIVDRRLNPKSKSLGNRQRFLRRAKAEIKEAVRDAVKNRKVSDIGSGEDIAISTKSLREPTFSLDSKSGSRDFVLPGNNDLVVGDAIPKPPPAGGRGSKGSKDGEGEDEFVFALSRDEFLDLFFEDLRLPNLIKAKLKSLETSQLVRAGFSTDGPPSKLNYVRTMRNSLARRIALSRPSLETLEKIEREIALAEAETPPDEGRIEELRARLARAVQLRKTVGYLDPLDLKFNRHERVPKPTTQAVMFCLMDVSASMTERLKDLAKRFFILLNIFLKRHYREVQVVFIRHTNVAAEVDEETFFTGRETGGTVISTALVEMQRVIDERYPLSDWNIYAAQASDGHNFGDDMEECLAILEGNLLEQCQYFAYIEVGSTDDGPYPPSEVWDGYEDLVGNHENFAMRRVADAGDIYPVFRNLFSEEKTKSG
ncbi:MAG: YeaH/YhbH family protein [Alphaproteobacteria bacterium]|nr:YeaH/YhbH family protein [Alphaproteobacteria bacterium]